MGWDAESERDRESIRCVVAYVSAALHSRGVEELQATDVFDCRYSDSMKVPQT